MKIKSILKLGTLALLTAALPACSFLDTDPQIIPDDGYYNSEETGAQVNQIVLYTSSIVLLASTAC